jgi:LysM repeat protein
MSEDTMSYGEGNAACPFLAFDDDRDHRADYADSRHRCYAAAEPEPLDPSHQERFCLSVAFAACPVFLEWARAEAAGVVGGAPAGAPKGKGSRTPAELPPFPGSQGRTTPAEASRVTSHAADPGSGLWGFEGAPKRTVAPPVTPPVAVPGASASAAPPTSRRQVTKPDWENPPRYDNFPRLRPRDDRSSNQTLLLAVIGVAAVFVLLILGPLFAPKGSSATPSPSLVAESPSASASESPTPEPGQTFKIYKVKPGDSLRGIASKSGITYEQILAANPLITNPNHIEVGQEIYIPWQTWVPPATPTPTPEPTPTPTPTPTPPPY